MYMKPTLFFGGSFLFSQASTHSIAFRSAHIGSGPGVLGLSAMQVNWLLPWRTTRIFPSESTSMIVASFPIACGAADMALLMISSSVIFPDGILCCWATANPETRTTEHANVSATCRMEPSPQLPKRDHSTPASATKRIKSRVSRNELPALAKDLIELDGDELRAEPTSPRRQALMRFRRRISCAGRIGSHHCWQQNDKAPHLAGQFRHGERTKAAIAERRKFSALLKLLRAG